MVLPTRFRRHGVSGALLPPDDRTSETARLVYSRKTIQFTPGILQWLPGYPRCHPKPSKWPALVHRQDFWCETWSSGWIHGEYSIWGSVRWLLHGQWGSITSAVYHSHWYPHLCQTIVTPVMPLSDTEKEQTADVPPVFHPEDHLFISFQNENIITELLPTDSNSSKKTLAIGNLITVLDSQSGSSLGTHEYRYWVTRFAGAYVCLLIQAW